MTECEFCATTATPNPKQQKTKIIALQHSILPFLFSNTDSVQMSFKKKKREKKAVIIRNYTSNCMQHKNASVSIGGKKAHEQLKTKSIL